MHAHIITAQFSTQSKMCETSVKIIQVNELGDVGLQDILANPILHIQAKGYA